MGEANARGTLDERIEEAKIKAFDEAEVIIILSTKDGKLNVKMLPRDDEPDQDSPAVIFASFIDHNCKQLAHQAGSLHTAYKDALNPQLVTDASPRRSILNAQGNIARATDDVNLILPATHDPI